MPFHWIESLLALAFAAVWAFIGVTLVGDRLGEVRRQRIAPQGPHFGASATRKRRRRAAASSAG